MQYSQDHLGQQIGDHRLQRQLGKGTFGTVYLAEHVHDHSLAAVKLLQLQVSSREDMRDFLNEARIIRLRHPHIVSILDFGLSRDDLPYLVMEYATGGTLRDRHPRGSKVPGDTIATYVLQLASALQYAHDRRIIHRDVKPENMLLKEDGTVLLSDFGIAKIMEQNSFKSVQTQIGTPVYMAPEQSRGKPGPASDQYGLAVVAYEWFAGQRPFQGGALEVMLQHRVDTPPSLCEFYPEISEQVEQVIFKALAKAPEERFPTIMDFAHTLQSALQRTTPPPQTIPTRPITIEARDLPNTPLAPLTPIQPPPSQAQQIPLQLATETPSHKNPYDAQVSPPQAKSRPLPPGNPASWSSTETSLSSRTINYQQIQTTPTYVLPNTPSVDPSVSTPHPRRRWNLLVISLCLVMLIVAGSGGAWLLLFSTYKVSQSGTGQGSPQFGFDAAHTHWNQEDQVINTKNVKGLIPLWSYQTGGAVTSSPAIANGLVYVGSNNSKLYAFDAGCRSACQPLWSYQTGGAVTSSPAVANGLVYVGSNDSKLYAFDVRCRSACQPLWSYQTDGAISSSPTIANGLVYVGSIDSKLYAFDAGCKSACQPLWSYQTGEAISSSPAIANGLVYVGSADSKLYAFDAGCKNACLPLWSYPTADIVTSSPAVANGLVYVGSNDSNLYAFDVMCRSACQPLWSYQIGSAISSSPAVANGLVYVGSNDSKLYAFDARCRSACQPLWSYQTAGPIASSPTIASGLVYVGSNDSKLYAFDAGCRSACQPLWSYQTGDAISSSPTIANGLVYVGSIDSKLYAFGLPG